MSEDRIQLMDLFRRDMTGIEPTRAWPEDQAPHPAFKNHPKVFKFEQSTYLFKVWLAGRDALAAQRDEGLAQEAELQKEVARITSAYQAERAWRTEGRAQNDALQQRLAKVESALSEVANWPDGGFRYGQDNIKRFVSSALVSLSCADGEKAPAPSAYLPTRKVKTEYSTAEEDAQADAWNAALDAVRELNR